MSFFRSANDFIAQDEQLHRDFYNIFIREKITMLNLEHLFINSFIFNLILEIYNNNNKNKTLIIDTILTLLRSHNQFILSNQIRLLLENILQKEIIPEIIHDEVQSNIPLIYFYNIKSHNTDKIDNTIVSVLLKWIRSYKLSKQYHKEHEDSFFPCLDLIKLGGRDSRKGKIYSFRKIHYLKDN